MFANNLVSQLFFFLDFILKFRIGVRKSSFTAILFRKIHYDGKNSVKIPKQNEFFDGKLNLHYGLVRLRFVYRKYQRFKNERLRKTTGKKNK